MEFELPPNSVAQLHELAVLFQASNRVLMDLGMLAHEGGPIHNYADVKAILFIHVIALIVLILGWDIWQLYKHLFTDASRPLAH